MKLKKSLSSVLLLSVVNLGTVAAPIAYAAETTVTSSGDVQTTQVTEVPTTVDVSSTESPTTSEEPVTTVGPVVTTEVPTTTEAPTTTSSSTTKSTSTAEDKEAAKLRLEQEALEREFGIGSNVLEGIIGDDNQYRVKTTTANPYRKFVRLEMKFPDGWYVGSGVMIGPDTILTAAHNVYDVETGKWASSVTAAPAQNGSSKPYGSYTASNYYVLRRWKTLRDETDTSYDTAVIKLSRKVDSRVGYLSVSTSQSMNQRIQVPGYPVATSTKKGFMYTMFGSVTDMTPTLMGYTVDTEGGQSGSGVLNNKNQVIGVHIKGYRKNGKYFINAARRVAADTLSMIKVAQGNQAPTIDVASYRTSDTKNVSYRLYHPGIKRHLYTQSLDEASVLTTRGWNFEGPKFRTASKGIPVYRLYHSGTREHLYTTSTNERDTLKTRGWRYEGIAWYSTGKKPIYRLYHAGLKVHLYTADANEKNVLSKRGWRYEGVAFNVQ